MFGLVIYKGTQILFLLGLCLLFIGQCIYHHYNYILFVYALLLISCIDHLHALLRDDIHSLLFCFTVLNIVLVCF